MMLALGVDLEDAAAGIGSGHLLTRQNTCSASVGGLQQLQSNDSLVQDQYGQVSFSSLQAFLQGNVSTYTYAPSYTPLSWRSFEGAFYVEDVIKVTPSWERRVGFRGESTNGWNEAYGRASNYAFDSSGVIETQPVVWWLGLGCQQREIPAGAAHRHGVVPLRIEKDCDPGGVRRLLRAP